MWHVSTRCFSTLPHELGFHSGNTAKGARVGITGPPCLPGYPCAGKRPALPSAPLNTPDGAHPFAVTAGGRCGARTGRPQPAGVRPGRTALPRAWAAAAPLPRDPRARRGDSAWEDATRRRAAENPSAPHPASAGTANPPTDPKPKTKPNPNPQTNPNPPPDPPLTPHVPQRPRFAASPGGRGSPLARLAAAARQCRSSVP